LRLHYNVWSVSLDYGPADQGFIILDVFLDLVDEIMALYDQDCCFKNGYTL
jgi:hypothetical protein